MARMYQFKHVDKAIDLSVVTGVQKHIKDFDKANVKHYLHLTYNTGAFELVYFGSDDTYYSYETKYKDILNEEFDLITAEINQQYHDKSDLELFRQWFDCVQDISPQYLKMADFKLAKKIYEKLDLRVPNSINDQLT